MTPAAEPSVAVTPEAQAAGAAGDQPEADVIAAAALGSPLVASMASGLVGEAATYLPGRRVAGVRIDGDHVEVHVVARWGAVLPELADGVRQAVTAVAAGRSVTVFIDDIELPDGP
ncbi:MAG: hypothetical protein QOG64_2778 [Acidimicrobiaceae bacterium]|nr:hypothetical protein [Acidimicrobiaceae bacterium]